MSSSTLSLAWEVCEHLDHARIHAAIACGPTPLPCGFAGVRMREKAVCVCVRLRVCQPKRALSKNFKTVGGLKELDLSGMAVRKPLTWCLPEEASRLRPKP